MNDVVIISAVRTPIGRIRGALSTVRPDDLAGHVIRAAVERSGVAPDMIEEVFFGCANQAGEDNRNVARMGALLAGLPHSVAGVTLNRLCASGLTAINQAARAIRCGEADVLVAGGVESMTRAPYSVPKNSQPFGPSGNVTAWDTTLGWRYPNPKMEKLFPLETMGETAENIYEQSRDGRITGGEINRAEQDRFALQSHTRAVAALNSGAFLDEIVSVPVPQQKGDPVVFDVDELAFAEKSAAGYVLATNVEKLSKLSPAFRKEGTVTAGNSSSLNDGACALILMSAARAETLKLKSLARWVGSATAGVDPRVMGLGPVFAVRRLLERFRLTTSDLDLIELNEAFAVQALAVMHELGMREENTNIHGGAIALGHPLGCTGARIVTTLVHALRRRPATGNRKQYGLAALCVGVGQGEATLIERL